MQIEVSKSELAGALSALGKLVCRTSPVEVRYGRSKSVAIVYEDGKFGVDSTLMRTSHIDWPKEQREEGDCEVAELPRLFIGYLSELAPIVNRNDYRQMLRGIHFCKGLHVYLNPNSDNVR